MSKNQWEGEISFVDCIYAWQLTQAVEPDDAKPMLPLAWTSPNQINCVLDNG